MWELDYVSWSPDGSKVVGSVRDDQRQRLTIINGDGSDPVPVGVPGAGPTKASQARWSPTGHDIAFVVDQGDETIPVALYIVDARRPDHVRQLTHPTPSATGGVSDSLPCWSPDGTRLGYRHAQDGTYDFWTVTATGADEHQVLAPSSGVAGCSWSPDGTTIAVAVNSDSGGSIVLVDVSTGRPTTVAADSDEKWAPAWSPDGKRVVFSAGPRGNEHLLLWSADKGTVRRLTTNPDDELAPAWSPDATQIAYVCVMPGQPRHICVFDTGTGRSEQLTHDTLDDTFPTWRPKP